MTGLQDTQDRAQTDAFSRAQTAALPLLGTTDAARCLAWRKGCALCAGEFLHHVMQLAQQLPDARHMVNLCEDRYAFLVAFCAALVRGQTNLLPPSRAPQAVADILAIHPDAYTVGDQPKNSVPGEYLQIMDRHLTGLPSRFVEMPTIAGDHVAAIGYTSGSTGRPQASVKTWASYAASTGGNLAMYRRHLEEPFHVLATVPPQHMYGMEMSVLLPLFGNIGVHAARPLFPADVARCLAELPRPRLLVITPVHLCALVASGQAMPALDAMVSATAPMPEGLACAAEAHFGAPLLEVFGSTETCVIASRRSALEDEWTTYPGVRIHPQPDGTCIEAPQLAEPATLADIFQVTARGFRLMGRNSDLLDMAGKRASLADLNQRLLAIDGVEDGAIFQLDTADRLGVRRLAALVVAPDRSEVDILAVLRRAIDPVFVPRPLRKVERLPRNATGKLPRAALLAMVGSG